MPKRHDTGGRFGSGGDVSVRAEGPGGIPRITLVVVVVVTPWLFRVEKGDDSTQLWGDSMYIYIYI